MFASPWECPLLTKLVSSDFTGNGTLDFAAISYNVPNYYEDSNPSVRVYYNKFAPPPVTDPQVISTIWADEPLLYFPNPTSIKKAQTIPLMEIGGYKVTFEIHPPNALPQGAADAQQAIRVLWGQISDSDGKNIRRADYVKPREKASAVVKAKVLKTGAEGVVLIRFESLTTEEERATWKENSKVPVKTLFEPSYSCLSLPDGSLKFKQYDTKDPKRDFWNLTGFHFRFADTKVNLAHMQFWTAGKEVNCGVHNHSDNTFLELHLCLFAGTGNGGMWWVKDGVTVDPNDPDATNDPADFDKLPLASLEEHGRLWNTDCTGKPIRRQNSSVDYPWHKWQAGDQKDGQDIWVAFEYNPELYDKY